MKHSHLYAGNENETFIFVRGGRERKNRHRFLPPHDSGSVERSGTWGSEWANGGNAPLKQKNAPLKTEIFKHR